MHDIKKTGKNLFVLFIVAGILTLLLALVLNGFDKLLDMSTITGLIFLGIGFMFIVGRSRTRANDASWQSMQVRQHISQEVFYKAEVKDSKEAIDFAWLFIIVGSIYFFLPMIVTG